MKRFEVFIQTSSSSSRWMTIGTVVAKTAAGAIRQIARDAKYFPDMIAIKAELK